MIKQKLIIISKGRDKSKNDMKLEYLVRKNAGQNLKETFKEGLTAILQHQVSEHDFLELKESDLLRNYFLKVFDNFTSSPKKAEAARSFSTYEPNELSSYVNNTLPSGIEGYLFFRASDKLGALKINSSQLVKYYLDLLKYDGDTIYFISHDKSLMIYLTYYEDAPEVTEYEFISLE